MTIKKKIHFMAIAACLLLIISPFLSILPEKERSAFAQTENSEEIYSFANSLFKSQDYYRAITEYRRLIFHFPNHPLARKSQLKIGYAYKKGKKWSQSEQEFEKIKKNYGDQSEGVEASFQLGEIAYLKKDFKNAILRYESFIKDYPRSELKDKSEYRIGFSYLNLEQYLIAEKKFRNISKKNKYYTQAALLVEETQKFSKLGLKRPWLAGTLSAFVPGAGQTYTERYSDAFLSFLLNGLFIWGTVESVENGNHVVAAILAFFEMGWYSGNIYSAIGSAHKYNRRKKTKLLHNLNKIFQQSKSYQKTNRTVRLFKNQGFSFFLPIMTLSF